MTGDVAALDGLKILVVEDLLLVADVISEGLTESGCEVVGPVARLEAGLALAQQAPIDGAVLDVNLAGESSIPIAQVLESRGIPYLFVTGYDADTALPPEYRGAPRLAKPFRIANLVALAASRFGRECQHAADG